MKPQLQKQTSTPLKASASHTVFVIVTFMLSVVFSRLYKTRYINAPVQVQVSLSHVIGVKPGLRFPWTKPPGPSAPTSRSWRASWLRWFGGFRTASSRWTSCSATVTQTAVGQSGWRTSSSVIHLLWTSCGGASPPAPPLALLETNSSIFCDSVSVPSPLNVR